MVILIIKRCITNLSVLLFALFSGELQIFIIELDSHLIIIATEPEWLRGRH